MSLARWADDDMARLDERRLVADPERRLARLDDEDLGIRMAVELRADARRGVDEDQRERQVPEIRADELVGVLRVIEPVERDDRGALLAQDRARLVVYRPSRTRPAAPSRLRTSHDGKAMAAGLAGGLNGIGSNEAGSAARGVVMAATGAIARAEARGAAEGAGIADGDGDASGLGFGRGVTVAAGRGVGVGVGRGVTVGFEVGGGAGAGAVATGWIETHLPSQAIRTPA